MNYFKITAAICRPLPGRIATCILVASMALIGTSQADQASTYETDQLVDCFPPQPTDRLNRQDYRKSTEKWRITVESHHFDSHYAAFVAGQRVVPKGRAGSGEPPSAGFDYTLWGFPNHPKALAAIEKISYQQRNNKLPGMRLPVNCYLERAVKYYPDDPMPHAIYAYYLARRNSHDKAAHHAGLADALSKGSMNVDLYLAWALIEMDDFEQAAAHAKRLYDGGYPLPGLRNRLMREGVQLN